MTTLVGKVRVLPPDTPGLPPATELLPEVGYRHDGTCEVCFDADPEIIAQVPGTHAATMVGFYCTRDRHDPDEVHVTHYRSALDQPVSALIVWGGE